MKKIFACLVCFACLACSVAFASEVDNARAMIQSGQLEAGAQSLVRYIQANPDDSKQTPKALLLLGQTLDRLQDLFSERAEKSCYWAKSGAGSPACMQTEAERLNAMYGPGSFKFVTDIAYVPYAGTHYQQLMSRFPKSDEAAEAEFQVLLKNLVGHPDTILPRVKDYLKRHTGGEANRRGLLLWARVNQDVWYIHRDWSWVLFNEKVSPDDLIVRAEPYRQEALRTFEQLIKKYPDTFEGQTAKREYDLLKANQNDEETYSILADTVGGAPDKWGSKIPRPVLTATQRGLGEPGWRAPAPTGPAYTAPPQPKPAAPVYQAPAPAPVAEPGEKKKAPSRWQ